MSENLRNYTKALYTLDAVVQRVPASAWDNASPCDQWSAREVLGHVIWGMKRLTAGATDSEPPTEQVEAEVAGPAPQTTWAGVRDGLFAALDHPGALQKVVPGPFGPAPLDATLQIMTMDALMHAWDLGQAAGVASHLPEDLANAGTALVGSFGDGVRRPGLFGAAVEPASDASAEDRYAAMCGRTKLR